MLTLLTVREGFLSVRYHPKAIMTKTLAPGCFGSSLFYRVGAAECDLCDLADRCAKIAKENEGKTVALAARLDLRFNVQTADKVQAWLSDRWKAKTVRKQSTERYEAIFTSWMDKGINPHHLKHGKNPVDKNIDPFLHAAFDFIITTKAFKPVDIQEHLRDVFPQLPKIRSQKYSKLLTDTLLFAKVITKEKKGVLCL